MSMSLRENITAVIETCFSETKDEIQEVAINRILELIRNGTADRKTENSSEIPNNFDKDINVRSKTEPRTCSVNGRPYSECTNCEHFRCTADEPQTDAETKWLKNEGEF